MIGPELAFGAGVVDGHVDAAEALHGLLDQAADLGLVAHIGAQVLGTHAQGAQFGGQGVAGFVAAAADDQAGPFAGEGQRGGAADAGQRASDEDDRVGSSGAPCGMGVAMG